jgi:N-acetylneuraminic acid mutarotase
MNQPRDGFGSATLPSGRILVAGGTNGSTVLASAEIYDPATGAWTVAARMHSPREHLTLTSLQSGLVLAVGGNSSPNGAPLASAEVYDLASNEWRRVRSMTTGRYFHAATLLANGMVMISGGCDQAFCNSVTGKVELFDPSTGTWQDGGTLAFPRDYHTSTALPDGGVLVTGGFGYSGELAEAERWDPATTAWSMAGSMADGRATHAAVALPGGRVLVMGGVGTYGTFLSSCEIYDPSIGPQGSWSSAAPMTYRRQFVTAVALSNGKMLVAGGWAYLGPHIQQHIPYCELYDPRLDAWTPTGPLATARSGHGAALLRNKDVLVMGGIGVAGYLSSAERFEP